MQHPRALAFRHDSLRLCDEPSRGSAGRLVSLSTLGKIAATLTLLYPALSAAEHLLPACENVVERIDKMGRRLREFPPDLFDEFLVALPDLFSKEILECAVAQPFVLLLRKIRHQI